MNDRFKFRIWHKPLKQMHYNDFIVTATGYMAKIYQQDDYMMKFNQCDLEFDKQCILMQCTGLKDKNDKLIYEGDIVKNNQNSLYSVEFEEFEHQTKFCLKRIENPDYYPHISTWQGIGYKDQKNYEVIGNIYENKELLESEG